MTYALAACIAFLAGAWFERFRPKNRVIVRKVDKESGTITVSNPTFFEAGMWAEWKWD